MKFGIRDDDTNYFTKPKELELAYKGIWERCPVGIAVVPFHACTKTAGIPSKYWHGNKVFPVGNNKPLIKFLRQKIQENKISILLHGHGHKDYPEGYEFVALQNPYEKVIEGKEYLEQVFDTKITAFVPPHNSMSMKSVRALRKAGIDIIGIPSVIFPSKSWFQEAFFERLLGHASPYPFSCFGNRELYYYYLTPNNTDYAKKEFEFARKLNGVFCVSNHYWEINKEPYKSAFRGFMDFVFSHETVRLGKVEGLFR